MCHACRHQSHSREPIHQCANLPVLLVLVLTAFLTQTFFAKVAGLSVKELNRLEIVWLVADSNVSIASQIRLFTPECIRQAFLELLDFDITLPPRDLTAHLKLVCLLLAYLIFIG